MPDRIRIIDKTAAYQGYFRIDRYQLTYRRFDGAQSPTLMREVLERGQVGAVLPYDPERNSVLLIEQFRPGAFAADWEPWLIECVAGVIEDGESATDVVRREALEEAGCTITDLIPVANFLTTPGASSETVALFCGRTDASGAGGLHGVAAEGEDIRAEEVPFKRALAMLAAGRIVNATTLVALQWLALNIDSVRERWRAPQITT